MVSPGGEAHLGLNSDSWVIFFLYSEYPDPADAPPVHSAVFANRGSPMIRAHDHVVPCAELNAHFASAVSFRIRCNTRWQVPKGVGCNQVSQSVPERASNFRSEASPGNRIVFADRTQICRVERYFQRLAPWPDRHSLFAGNPDWVRMVLFLKTLRMSDLAEKRLRTPFPPVGILLRTESVCKPREVYRQSMFESSACEVLTAGENCTLHPSRTRMN